MRYYRPVTAIVFLALLSSLVLAAPDPRPTLPPAPSISPAGKDQKDVAKYLDREHEQTLQAVDMVLRRSRPVYPEPADRHLAMLALDEAVHYGDPNSNVSVPVREFLTTRMKTAVYEMERTKVTSGAVVWKIYNHAFVVKTPSVSVAFDLTRGYWGKEGGYPEIDDLARRIIDRCDVLFISHDHGDHVDNWVIDAFLAQGKPVIVPESFQRQDSRFIKLARDGSTKHIVKLKTAKQLDVVMFPGFQGDLPDNVPLITTPEGISFAHTGDLFRSNSTKEDMSLWIDHVKDRWKVDMLLVNVWVSGFESTIKGFNPRIIITGHENEMGHDPFKRKGNFFAYDRLSTVKYPWILMAWGESYYYQPTK